MTTFPLPTLAPTIDANGITAPPYPDILTSLQTSFQTIFGTDIVLEASSQDGEQLAIYAAAQNDTNNAVIGAYRSFSPATGQRDALSSNVKLNGLKREVPSNSQATVTIVGVVGTQINNGLVGDNLGLNTQWALPPLVTIPPAGTIDVTATCTEEGSTLAGAATLTQILTPTRGWQTVNNVLAATPGNPVEDDADLRRRQSSSTTLPSRNMFSGVLAGIRDLVGVDRAWGYDNDTNATDGNTVPAKSISMVVEGGVLTDIAQVILNKKGPGCGTYGTTTENVTDQYGVVSAINFYQLALTRLYCAITIKALAGYVSTTGDAILAALAYYVENPGTPAEGIGDKVYYNKLWSAANLSGSAALTSSGLNQAQLDAMSNTFDITILHIATTPVPTGVVDIAIAFNAAANLAVSDIALTVI